MGVKSVTTVRSIAYSIKGAMNAHAISILLFILGILAVALIVYFSVRYCPEEPKQEKRLVVAAPAPTWRACHRCHTPRSLRLGKWCITGKTPVFVCNDCLNGGNNVSKTDR